MSVSRALFYIGALAGLLLAPIPVASAAGLQLGKLGIGGTGCPAGTVSGTIGANTLSLKYSTFIAKAGGGKSFDRKACGLAIPVDVPAGVSIAIVGVHYRGFAKLPSGASATLSSELFYAGGKGPALSKSVKGPLTGRFDYTAVGPVSWSPCGADVNLRIQSSIRVTTSGGKSASMSIRSGDVAAGLVYDIKQKSC
jgi:hypothetical protein